MRRFLTPLINESGPGVIGSRPYILREDLVYHTSVWGGEFGAEIKIPKGYSSDFASIPRAFWRILPPGGEYRRAAVVHDWLCDAGKLRNPICDYKEAALVFKEAMEADLVPKWKIWMCYKAVRYFGPRF